MHLFRSSLVMLVLLTLIITGLAYPLFITGLAQLFFLGKQMVHWFYQDDKLIGSELIGQSF